MNEKPINNQPRVVILKDYPARHRLMGILSLPLFFLLTTVIVIPFLFLGRVGITESIIMTVVAEILVIMIALKYVDQLSNWRDKLKIKNFKWSNVLAGLGIGFLLYIILQVVAVGLEKLGMPITSTDTSSSVISLTGFEQLLIAFLFVPFIVPFVEEVFFRGYVLGFLRSSFKDINSKKAVLWSLLLSSLIFAVVHFQGLANSTDVFTLIWIFFMALVNGVLFIKTDSIYTSFALHLGYNGLTILVSTMF